MSETLNAVLLPATTTANYYYDYNYSYTYEERAPQVYFQILFHSKALPDQSISLYSAQKLSMIRRDYHYNHYHCAYFSCGATALPAPGVSQRGIAGRKPLPRARDDLLILPSPSVRPRLGGRENGRKSTTTTTTNHKSRVSFITLQISGTGRETDIHTLRGPTTRETEGMSTGSGGAGRRCQQKRKSRGREAPTHATVCNTTYDVLHTPQKEKSQKHTATTTTYYQKKGVNEHACCRVGCSTGISDVQY